jgi:hypothetical protein
MFMKDVIIIFLVAGLSALCISGSSSPVYAIETWASTYGSSINDSVGFTQQTPDGGFIILGNNTTSGNYNFYVIKTDASGAIQWQKKYNYTNSFTLRYIQPIATGYVLGGDGAVPGSNGGPWIVTLDSAGNIVSVSGSRINSSTGGTVSLNYLQRSSGGYIKAGSATYQNPMPPPSWFCYAWTSIDGIGSAGDMTCGAINSSFYFSARYVKQTSDNGFIVAGSCSEPICIFKISSSGGLQWIKEYSYGLSASPPPLSAIEEASDGSYWGVGSYGSPNYDLSVFKFSSTGTLLWLKSYGGANGDSGKYIKPMPDGGCVVAGITYSYGSGDADIWLLRLDSTGAIIWQKTYGGSSYESLQSFEATTDGGFVIGGTTSSFGAGGSDIWVLKIDANGEIAPDCSFILTSTAAAVTRFTSGGTYPEDFGIPPLTDITLSLSSSIPDSFYNFQCGCNTPEPPMVTAEISNLNEITVSWQPVPGANSYNVFRRYLECGNIIEEQIVSGITSIYYIDTTVQGGIEYSYSATAAGGCESQKSNWASNTATGECALAPCFNGVDSIISTPAEICSLTAQWNPGTAACPAYPQITYSVYRSIDPVFIPSAYNQIATCLNSTTYTDNNVFFGTTYYYIVRAEDSSTNGSGPCNNGTIDQNLVRKSGSPQIIAFSESFNTAHATTQSSMACTTNPVAPGTVPDHENFPGNPLMISKSGSHLYITWDAPGGSCITSDYSIYRGSLPWMTYNHAPLQCSTGGLTNALIDADSGSYYYLVVAKNSSNEGSYGLDSSHIQRPAASSPCLVQDIGTCN